MTDNDGTEHGPGTGPATAPPPRVTRWVALAVGLALFGTVVIVATHRAEERALVALLRRARPVWLAAAAGLQAFTYLTEAALWFRVLANTVARSPFRSFISLSLAKLFVDQTVPSGGVSGSAFVLHALTLRRVPRAIGVAALLLEMLGEYSAFVAALLLGLGLLALYQPLPVSIVIPSVLFFGYAAALIAFLVLLGRGRVPGRRLLLRIRPARWQIEMGASASRSLMQAPRLLATAFGLEFAIFLLDAATFWCVFRALDVSVHPGPVFAAFMLANVARTLGIMPGGLGVFEAVSVASLHLTGLPIAAALAGTLLLRGFTFWLPLLPGFLCARHESRVERQEVSILPPQKA